MSLGPRLAEVARHVIAGKPMADVGTDHAQLPAVLVRTGVVPSAIAIDNKAGPLAHAARTLAQAGITAVDLRRGDGLSPLAADEVATVTMAGLGGARMIRLLDAWPHTNALPRLVLQPNTDWEAVRRHIARRCYHLRHETMLIEREQAYVTLVVEPANPSHADWGEDQAALMLGPRLLQERPAAWLWWMQMRRAKLEAILDAARAAGASDTTALQQRIELLSRHANRSAP